MNKSVMISGANGYFGGIACEFFKDIGWKVFKAMRRDGADVFFDLDSPEQFASTIFNEKIDLFIHAAAAHEVTCYDQPYRSIFQNVAGTRAALEFCHKNSIEKFVYISTFHVFGNPSGVIDETTPPLPANDYGLSHLQAEQYVDMYTRLNKVKGLVLRPSNFFGVPVDLEACNRWTLVPLSFCRDAIQNGVIELKTPGYQKRNFVSVLDICHVILNYYTKQLEYGLVHISGPETISIRHLAYCIKNIVETEYMKTVDLRIPNSGSHVISRFDYNSLYLGDIYCPRESISSYIKHFAEELLK